MEEERVKIMQSCLAILYQGPLTPTQYRAVQEMETQVSKVKSATAPAGAVAAISFDEAVKAASQHVVKKFPPRLLTWFNDAIVKHFDFTTRTAQICIEGVRNGYEPYWTTAHAVSMVFGPKGWKVESVSNNDNYLYFSKRDEKHDTEIN